MRILSVVGARPEFIQAMPVSRILRAKHEEILVHTGQHYDYQMSQTFFDELDIPVPDYNLGIGSASQARQTAEIMVRLEEVMIEEKPDFVLMRGDTNSSLASALVASKLYVPFAHIEAGERSFYLRMPEEINRIVADRLANMHFCVSQNAVEHLSNEGIRDSVHLVGDVMLDALLFAKPIAKTRSKILEQLRIEPQNYALVTIHRPANTERADRLKQIAEALNQVSETVIFPAHPRTQKAISDMKINFLEHVRIIAPVGYFDMLTLEENARVIATDSGGVQREAYYLKIPCLTLRDETEWIATIETGWNRLVGVNQDLILESWLNFAPPAEHPAIYGDGQAAKQIGEIIDMVAARMVDQKKDSKNQVHPNEGDYPL